MDHKHRDLVLEAPYALSGLVAARVSALRRELACSDEVPKRRRDLSLCLVAAAEVEERADAFRSAHALEKDRNGLRASPFARELASPLEHSDRALLVRLCDRETRREDLSSEQASEQEAVRTGHR